MPTEGARSRAARTLSVLVVAMAASVGGEIGGENGGDCEQGRALFAGERSLSAHLAGQTFELPQDAVRCVSCHESDGTIAGGARPTFATALTRLTLTRALARRGGPPSVYRSATLCRAVRDGIDP